MELDTRTDSAEEVPTWEEADSSAGPHRRLQEGLGPSALRLFRDESTYRIALTRVVS